MTRQKAFMPGARSPAGPCTFGDPRGWMGRRTFERGDARCESAAAQAPRFGTARRPPGWHPPSRDQSRGQVRVGTCRVGSCHAHVMLGHGCGTRGSTRPIQVSAAAPTDQQEASRRPPGVRAVRERIMERRGLPARKEVRAFQGPARCDVSYRHGRRRAETGRGARAPRPQRMPSAGAARRPARK